MVCAMEESEAVAAIVTGDPAGLAEALDTYATPLFAYCRSILPQAEAADVVEDTFVVARAKLDGLLDPARVGQWLRAVARNECFRRIIAVGGTPPPEPVTPVPGAILPDGLRGRIMKVCTDDTPAGRAHRTTVTHRSGQFGYDGFPKPVTVARPRRVSRVVVAAAAVVGAGALVTGLIVALSGGPQPNPVADSVLSSPTGVLSVPTPVSGTVPGPTARPRHSAKPKVTLAATHSPAPPSSTPPTTAIATTADPKPAPSRTAPRIKPPPPPPVSHTPNPPQPTPSVSTSTYTPPPNPILIVNPMSLSLVSTNDAAASGSISIEGYGTTVHWSAVLSTGGGHITVKPVAGTLKPGASTNVGVTASGTSSFTARITFMPGDHVVTVTVTAKKVVTKKAAIKTASTGGFVRPYRAARNSSSSRREGAVAGPSRVTAKAAAALARPAAVRGSRPAASAARKAPACASPAPVVSTASTDGAGTSTGSRSLAALIRHPSRPRRTMTPAEGDSRPRS
jgi:hypothetical protein